MSTDDYEVKRFDNRVQPHEIPSAPRFRANVIPPVDEESLSAAARSNESTPKHNLHDTLPPVTRPKTAATDISHTYSSDQFESEGSSDTGVPPAQPAMYISPEKEANYEEYPMQIHTSNQSEHRVTDATLTMNDHSPQQDTSQQQPHQVYYSNREDHNDFEDSEENISTCGLVLYYLAFFIVILTFPIAAFFCVKVVQEYERAVIFRLGQALKEPKGPGMFMVIPGVEYYIAIDLRTLSIDVPPQEVLTKDCVTISVDAVVYYKIVNPQRAVIKVANCYSSTLLLSHTTLRTVLGTRELVEILSARDAIATQMQDILDVATEPWGVKVERVEIKDVRLPTDLQRAMAKEAESKRDAQAKLIAAEGEKLASRSLCEAANIMHGSKSALQLRYLQTLSMIATEKPSTILFPLPVKSLATNKKLK